MVIPCTTEHEAYFVSGALNSMLFRFAVSSYAIEIQLDPHLVENLRVPKYDPNAELHQSIAAEAKRLSTGATDASDQVNPKLDALCKTLWGVTDQELKAVEAAYRDLYIAAPREKPSAEKDSEE